MRVPSSKGISPVFAYSIKEVMPTATTPAARSERHPQDRPAPQQSVDVQLTSRAAIHAKYLRLLKDLPDVRQERVEQVKARLGQQGTVPGSDALAGAIVAHYAER